MHDYDVEALALIAPPPSAVLQSYRPAVSVRNNGVHNALATGYLRIYAADLLIFETELYSATITPGETGLAQATDYWTPPAVGHYMIFGYVTCPLDQFEPNNNLAPTTINVSGLPPPPPTPVTPHASQHEEGGQDEVSIDGLKGRTADAQLPLAHVANHQAAGSDQLNVGALLGELAQDQNPKTHSNAKHNPQMATASALSQHQGAAYVHTASTNLEQTANKGQPSGYAGLDNVGHVPDSQLATVPVPPPDAGDALTFGSGWSQSNALPHADKHAVGGDDELHIPHLQQTTAFVEVGPNDPEFIIAQLDVPNTWKNDTLGAILKATGRLFSHAAPGGLLHLRLKQNNVTQLAIAVPASEDTDSTLDIEAFLQHVGGMLAKHHLRILLVGAGGPASAAYIQSGPAASSYNLVDLVLTITAQFDNAAPTAHFYSDSALCFGTGDQL